VPIGNREWTFTGYIARNQDAILNLGLEDAEPKRKKQNRRQRQAQTTENMAAEDREQEDIAENNTDQDIYTAEATVAKKTVRGSVFYRVRWERCCPDDDTWEPATGLKGCQELINKYEEQA
jgi:hypothetical protein